MSAPSKLLPGNVTLRQFYKYLARYARYSPSSTRAISPTKRVRAPTEPGVGIFFYPADSWTKTHALATGPLGQTEETIHPSKFQISRPIAAADGNAAPELHYWGVGGAVQVTKNLISGVAQGFAVTLELHGVGYRAEADEERNKLVMRLGYSHVVEFPLNENDVFFTVLSPQLVQVAGLNRADVHQMAAKVRKARPPEPYKGKGVRYRNEPVRRKEAKKD